MNNHIDSSQRNMLLRVLISVVLIVCLIIFSAGILLKTGIELDTISVGRVMVSDFSLIWQDKLELQIGTVVIAEQNGSTTSSKGLKSVSRGISVSRQLVKLFSRVSIGKIRVGGFTGAVNLQQDAGPEASSFSLTSDDITFRSKLVLEPDTLVVDIREASSKRFNSMATGQIRVDIDKELLT